MKHIIGLLIIAITLCEPITRAEAQGRPARAFSFGKFTVSGSGILSLAGNPAQYMLAPKNKYPAELRGLAAIDLLNDVYVARFFEPAGTGAEGFFDVRFELKNGKIFARAVENAASIERIDAEVFERSCSYVFDWEKRKLLKIEAGKNKSSEVSMMGPLKAMP